MTTKIEAPKRKVRLTGVAIDSCYNRCEVPGCGNGAVTAVWMDGRSQFNVCALHLKEKLESGEWVLVTGK